MKNERGLFDFGKENRQIDKNAAAIIEKAKKGDLSLPEELGGAAEAMLFREIKDILDLYRTGGLTAAQAASRKTYAAEVTYANMARQLLAVKRITDALDVCESDPLRLPLERDGAEETDYLAKAMNYLIFLNRQRKGVERADG